MSHETVYDPKQANMVYMRPQEGNRPVKYQSSLGQQGMLMDTKHSIAMYTSRAGMAVGPAGPAGPAGPPGADENSKFDTIIASASDEITPITVGGPKTTFRSPYPMDLSSGYVRISLTTACTGAAFIVDLTMNGASLFSTRVQIDDGMKTSVGSGTPAVLAITDIPDDAEYLVYVDQVGGTIAGMGLKVAVTGIKV